MSDREDAAESDEDAADEEWAYTLSDLEDREAAAEEQTRPIEADTPSLEGTVFFLLGVAFAVFVISRLFLG
ncbi:DUF7312 domain-containing protein [Natronomonas amylolytica]|uniref:DUF7312 domain-containing protein n=1 Tax=Natronomonas amylolytica TaxID=3108498 RepID=UPI00300A0D8D